MNSLESRLSTELEVLRQQGLLRQRRLHPESLIDFAGNDYLGLATSAQLKLAASDGLAAQPCGSGASPLVNGYSSTHRALEQALCQRTGHEAALLFSSGFGANQALITTLFSDRDFVVADKLVHASIIDGLQDSGARFRRFQHNDLSSAATLLARQAASALITESVFSMDGDCAPLAQLRALTREHGAWLIVDDAHGFATPKGAALDCTSDCADVQLVTFGKALGCQGAALLGSQLFVDYMVARCRHYIYSTALSPLAAAIALAALGTLDSDTSQRKLALNIQRFRSLCQQAGLSLMPSDTPIQPMIVGDNLAVQALAQSLKDEGFLVGAIRPPTVPAGSARLRITLSASHTLEQIQDLVSALARLT